MNNILDFTHIEARTFFLKEESYCNFDLPPYFTFRDLLDKVSQTIEGHDIEEFKNVDPNSGKPQRPFPSDLENVNHLLLINKDGKYDWRPLQLIHPALYVALVHIITKKDNWNLIIERFERFQENSKIRCQSIPVETETELSDKATSVINWWQKIEQSSLELALQYEYILHTDISDCYCSIYTHSIPWALHEKSFAKNPNNRSMDHVGNAIDKYLRDMSYGQTNGIPQGSVLMDFLAEMILGYADLELSNRIADAKIEDYEILRYRDDYRIFANNPQDAEEIAKFLTEILIDLGMRLNAQKTMVSNNVIRDSIKPDKLFWNSGKKGAKGLQAHLLLIHQLAEKFPNSGSLIKALDKYLGRIQKLEETNENIRILISILIDIAFKNPRTYPIVCAILSKFLSLIDEEAEREAILNHIATRFSRIPNTGFIKIWLQRVTLKIDRAIEYDEKLCQRVNENSIKIWNSDWLNDDLNSIVDSASLIDERVIDEMEPIIDPDEIQMFDY